MVSAYIREQQRYSRDDLAIKLKSSGTELTHLLGRLKEYGVLKSVAPFTNQQDLTELIESDVEIADVDDSNFYFVFTFVGIISIEGRLLKCYPKYIHSSEEPSKEMKQIIKVLEKYQSKKQTIYSYREDQITTSGNLAIILFLLRDYFDHGIYETTREIIETNGNGEILWDKTVNDSFTLIQDGRPFYPELFTRRRVTSNEDFFRRLHKSILNQCSNELEKAELLYLFDIPQVIFDDENLTELGDDSYILNRIEKELNVQFNTHKQQLLKVFHAFISREHSLENLDTFTFFGTNSFNLVWESILSDVLENQLFTTLGGLKLPAPLSEKFKSFSSKMLIDIIQKPIWHGDGFSREAADTFIPDIISISEVDGDTSFIIYDAKYYDLEFEPGILRGQPGIESISKQYMYQLAYRAFMEEHEIRNIVNCFLMPTEGSRIVKKGQVELGILKNLGLADIQVYLLPAETVYRYYLESRKLSASSLSN